MRAVWRMQGEEGSVPKLTVIRQKCHNILTLEKKNLYNYMSRSLTHVQFLIFGNEGKNNSTVRVSTKSNTKYKAHIILLVSLIKCT